MSKGAITMTCARPSSGAAMGRPGQLVPTFGHYTSQHNNFFDHLANVIWRGPIHKTRGSTAP